MSEYKTYYDSPVGWLCIKAEEEGITAIEFVKINEDPSDELSAEIKKCVKQLNEYFAGKRTTFDLKINLTGSEFQNQVWNELLKIPYGTTVSYLDIAKALGDEKSVRAVGNANGQNKIPIVIPCHRVIGVDGKLTGYAGGLTRKRWLLNHEKKHSSKEYQMDMF